MTAIIKKNFIRCFDTNSIGIENEFFMSTFSTFFHPQELFYIGLDSILKLHPNKVERQPKDKRQRKSVCYLGTTLSHCSAVVDQAQWREAAGMLSSGRGEKNDLAKIRKLFHNFRKLFSRDVIQSDK